MEESNMDISNNFKVFPDMTENIDDDVFFNAIKEEELDIVFDEVLLDSKLQDLPVVYTTRLEDMAILNQETDSFPVDYVTNRIISESKPELLTTKPQNQLINSLKFPSLKRKLSQIFNTPKTKYVKQYGRKKNKKEPTDAVENETNSLPHTQLFTELPYRLKQPPTQTPNAQSPILVKTEKEILDRNKRLLKMCKPLSIVLVDFKKRSFLDSSDTISIFDSSSSDDELLLSTIPQKNATVITEMVAKQMKGTKPLHVKNKTLTDIDELNCIIMRNVFCNETEMYIIEDGSVKEYYVWNNSFGITDKHYVQYATNVKKWKELYFCCWQKRDQYFSIQAEELKKNIQISTLEFLKKPHYCQSWSCTCCCRINYLGTKPDIAALKQACAQPSSNNHYILQTTNNQTESLLEDTEIKKKDKEISETLLGLRQTESQNYGYDSNWRQKLLDIKTSDSKTFIDKILSLNLDKNDETKPKTDIDTTVSSIDKAFWITLPPESYYIEPNGSITYLKNKDIGNLSNNVKLCCWYKRNAIMQDVKDISQSLMEMLKTNHDCLPGKCSCCCKEKQTNTNKLKSQSLAEVRPPKYLKNETLGGERSDKTNVPVVNYDKLPMRASRQFKTHIHNKLELLRKKSTDNQNKQKNLSNTRSSPTATAKENEINEKNHLNTCSVATSKENENDQQNHSSTDHIATSIENHNNQSTKIKNLLNTRPIATYTKPRQILPTQNLSKPTRTITSTIKDSVSTINTAKHNVSETEQNLSINSMITTILDRFKDVKLTIDPDGKIAAELNTPVNDLCTAELKVLANILAHAQEQVKTLGLAPGTSINTNNLPIASQIEGLAPGTSINNNDLPIASQIEGLAPGTSINTNDLTIASQIDIIDCKSEDQRNVNPSNIQIVAREFSETANKTRKSFLSAFEAFTQRDQTAEIPKITGVFSLKNMSDVANQVNVTTPYSQIESDSTCKVHIPRTTSNPSPIRVNEGFAPITIKSKGYFVSSLANFTEANKPMPNPSLRNVFSLNNVNKEVIANQANSLNAPSSSSSWYRKPEYSDDTCDAETPDPEKTKIEPKIAPATEPESKALNKIRVVDPSKLGISPASKDVIVPNPMIAATAATTQQNIFFIDARPNVTNVSGTVNSGVMPPLVQFGGYATNNVRFLQATIIPGHASVQNPVIINSQLNSGSIQMVAPLQTIAQQPVSGTVFHIADPKAAAKSNQLKLVPVTKHNPPQLKQMSHPGNSVTQNHTNNKLPELSPIASAPLIHINKIQIHKPIMVRTAPLKHINKRTTHKPIIVKKPQIIIPRKADVVINIDDDV